MKKKIKFTFYLNGSEIIPFDQIEFQIEKNPFPADHKFLLIIDYIILDGYENEGEYDIIDHNKAMKLSWMINYYKAEVLNDIKGQSEMVVLKYFINTVDKVTVKKNQVLLEGVCSSIKDW